MTKPITILTFDPGETTGVVIAKVTYADKPSRPKFNVLMQAHHDYHDRFNWVNDVLTMMPYQHIVVEDFLVYPSKVKSLIHDRLLTVRLIGYIDGQLYHHDMLGRTAYQYASDVSSTKINIPEFKHVNLHHAKQCLPHLRYFTLQNRHELFSQYKRS